MSIDTLLVSEKIPLGLHTRLGMGNLDVVCASPRCTNRALAFVLLDVGACRGHAGAGVRIRSHSMRWRITWKIAGGPPPPPTGTHHLFGVMRHLGPDLNQLVPQGRERPVLGPGATLVKRCPCRCRPHWPLIRVGGSPNSNSRFTHSPSGGRTIRPGILPSEQVVAVALRQSLPLFLADADKDQTLANFIRYYVGRDRAEGLQLVA